MVTIKEAFIELADCNTTLVQLGSTPLTGGLRLGSKESYRELYRRIASAPSDYETPEMGKGGILKRLTPVYHYNRYWHQYFGTSTVETYHQSAWEKLVPIEAQLNPKLRASGANAKLKISLIPRVLLYPFGWSTWISLWLRGEQTLRELADLLRRLVHDAAFSLAPEPEDLLTLNQVFQRVARGVWADAFGGGEVRAFQALEPLSVTTVMEKSGGIPVSPQELAALPLLISPSQPLNNLPPGSIRKPKLGAATNLDYALQNDLSVFLWAEHRLKSGGKKSGGNDKHSLHCHHNNIFLSLVHAWQLISFLKQASVSNEKSGSMAELARKAIEQIDDILAKIDGYRSVAQFTYLQSKKAILDRARGAFP